MKYALLAPAILLSLVACGRAPDVAGTSGPAEPVPVATEALPAMTVYRSPTCGCCGKWVQHVRDAGFDVVVHEVDDVSPVKERVGVPFGKGSCHTAEVGGYFVEGHVPAEDIKRLLREAPAGARGLVLPGMPVGSPGMEVPGRAPDAYTVEVVDADRRTTAFANH